MATTENPEKVMSVMEHLRELRNGILISLAAFLVATIVAFIWSDSILGLFMKPFGDVSSTVDKKLVVSNITEGFTTQIRVSVIAGLILSLPVHMFNLIRFIYPGIEAKVRKVILGFIVASFVLVVFGTYLAYFRVLPAAVAFLTNPYFVPKGVGFLLNYQQNVFFVFSFILWSVAAFQTPLILELLLMFNVVKRKAVFGATRYIIVGIFIVAAIITPSPDFVSQLGVGIPMTVLYFLALLVARIFRWGED
jgi:sec-independent protein translocase protein TatC